MVERSTFRAAAGDRIADSPATASASTRRRGRDPRGAGRVRARALPASAGRTVARRVFDPLSGDAVIRPAAKRARKKSS